MSREVLMLVDALAREKNVDKDVVFAALEAALASASKKLFEEDADGREVDRSGDNVVGHLTVGHTSVFPVHLFIECEADALGDAAFDLSRGHDWMEHAAYFL